MLRLPALVPQVLQKIFNERLHDQVDFLKARRRLVRTDSVSRLACKGARTVISSAVTI
jgi:hypothetical protein